MCRHSKFQCLFPRNLFEGNETVHKLSKIVTKSEIHRASHSVRVGLRSHVSLCEYLVGVELWHIDYQYTSSIIRRIYQKNTMGIFPRPRKLYPKKSVSIYRSPIITTYILYIPIRLPASPIPSFPSSDLISSHHGPDSLQRSSSACQANCSAFRFCAAPSCRCTGALR